MLVVCECANLTVPVVLRVIFCAFYGPLLSFKLLMTPLKICVHTTCTRRIRPAKKDSMLWAPYTIVKVMALCWFTI